MTGSRGRCYAIRYSVGALPLVIALMSGCVSGAAGGAMRPQAPPPTTGTNVEHVLRDTYSEWSGTRHRLGGTDGRGIDCSAFVQRVFADRFGLGLPRTTKAQAKTGREVARTRLRAGDLVFFRPRSYPRHVGIYLSDGRFMHVSAKKGVMISDLTERYWSRSYWTARRVLDRGSTEQMASRP